MTSGVYIYKDADGNVIYIGKAVNLRKRVESYLRAKDSLKTGMLVARVADIETIPTLSEAEALLLEAGLIKKHQPRYNVELKDGKTYPFIQITKEEFPLVSVVRVSSRQNEGKSKGDLYGPYVESRLIREALQIIRRIFPFRSCSPFAHKLCLDYHIGLCAGPCEGKISKAEYARNIRHVRLILDGNKDGLYRQLRKEMEEFSRVKEFEKAGTVRDQMRAIGALYSSSADINYFKEAEQLQRALHLPKEPLRIECFDISNIMGTHSTGSMVSFLNGKPDKNNYRRFKIKTVKGIDDVQMMGEVVRRRYTRLKKEGAAFPDLILIDGGKGQLGGAVKELKELDVSIPIAALAKREEEIFLPTRRLPVILPPDSLGLKLVMRVRDEAHRFALKYHRFLRGREALDKDETRINPN